MLPLSTARRRGRGACAAARAAQRTWAATPWRERAAVLLRFHDLVLDRQDEVLDLIQLESGKARRTPSRRSPTSRWPPATTPVAAPLPAAATASTSAWSRC